MSDKSKKRLRERVEQSRPGGSGVPERLTYLLIGGGIGAIIALLFAPKSGTELRGDIADVTRKGIDKTREGARYVGDKADDYYESVRARASEWYDSVHDTTASRQSGQYSAAVEAGKEAYRREKLRRETQAASDLGGDETKDDYPYVNPLNSTER